MALITCYDSAGEAHQKEPIDAREACLHNGFTMAPPGGTGIGTGGAPAEPVPTLAELLSMRDALVRREGELNDQAQRMVEQAHANDTEAARLKQVADDQAAEVQRLVDSSAQLANDRVAFEASKAAAPAPAGGKAKPAAAPATPAPGA